MSSDPQASSSAPSEDLARAHRRALGALSFCMLLGWVLLLLPLPWSLGAGIAGLAAAVLLVRATIAAWRIGQQGSAVLTALLGAGAVLVLVGSSALSAVLYGPMHELQQCRRDAITVASRDACDDGAEESTLEWFSSLLGG